MAYTARQKILDSLAFIVKGAALFAIVLWGTIFSGSHIGNGEESRWKFAGMQFVIFAVAFTIFFILGIIISTIEFIVKLIRTK